MYMDKYRHEGICKVEGSERFFYTWVSITRTPFLKVAD